MIIGRVFPSRTAACCLVSHAGGRVSGGFDSGSVLFIVGPSIGLGQGGSLTPGLGVDVDDMAMLDEAVDERRDAGGAGKHRAHCRKRQVRRDDDGPHLVAPAGLDRIAGRYRKPLYTLRIPPAEDPPPRAPERRARGSWHGLPVMRHTAGTPRSIHGGLGLSSPGPPFLFRLPLLAPSPTASRRMRTSSRLPWPALLGSGRPLTALVGTSRGDDTTLSCVRGSPCCGLEHHAPSFPATSRGRLRRTPPPVSRRGSGDPA